MSSTALKDDTDYTLISTSGPLIPPPNAIVSTVPNTDGLAGYVYDWANGPLASTKPNHIHEPGVGRTHSHTGKSQYPKVLQTGIRH